MGRGNRNKPELQYHQHQPLLETKEATPHPRLLKEEAQGFASTVEYPAITPKIVEPPRTITVVMLYVTTVETKVT